MKDAIIDRMKALNAKKEESIIHGIEVDIYKWRVGDFYFISIYDSLKYDLFCQVKNPLDYDKDLAIKEFNDLLKSA